MASISKDRNGRRKIQFKLPDQDRKTIYLGKMPSRHAEAIKVKIEQLIAAMVSGCVWDNETARWVAELPNTLASKLSKAGLIPKSKAEASTGTLAGFIDLYIEKRANLKPNTCRNYKATRDRLVNHFGANHLLAGITPGDADEWRESLLEALSPATVSREVKRARQFFRAAERKRLIPGNPFMDVPVPAQVNKSREYFVTLETIDKVIDACPDAQWRLIVALCRFGGLRCPSEILTLTWDNVDWENSRLTINSPKTEHHPGGDSRVIPVFPELRPHLEIAWEQCKVGDTYVIMRYRRPNPNLGKILRSIIKRAGVKPWPKLFQNLRASRQTELTDKFPLHVVCEWLGNSAPIADKHYLQVTDEHYNNAITSPPGQGDAKSDAQVAQRIEKVAQNAAQQVTATGGINSQETKEARENRAFLQPLAAECETLPSSEVPPRGVEPLSLD